MGLPVAAPALEMPPARETIQGLELGGRKRQLAVLVLPVEGEQPGTEGLQVRRRGGASARKALVLPEAETRRPTTSSVVPSGRRSAISTISGSPSRLSGRSKTPST